MHLTPIYGLFAIISYMYNIPAWVVLFPLFFVFIPATAYLMTIKCRNCHSAVYTVEHLRKAPGGLRKLPLHIFHECPECGSRIDP